MHTTSAFNSVWLLHEMAGQDFLLDVTCASDVGIPFLQSLAAGWPCGSEKATRLGIRIRFERWALLRTAGATYLAELAAKGVKIELFYDQQNFSRWFTEDRVVHDVVRVIEHLKQSVYTHTEWPRLLDAAAFLIDQQPPETWATLLTDLAEIALLRGAANYACSFANKALHYVASVPSPIECRALRILGEALYVLRQEKTAVHVLQDVVLMATNVGSMFEEATAAHDLGMIALGALDFDRAAEWFHRATTSLGPRPTELAVWARHGFTVASRSRGRLPEENRQNEIDYPSAERAGN